jgi:hypothetical protein
MGGIGGVVSLWVVCGLTCRSIGHATSVAGCLPLTSNVVAHVAPEVGSSGGANWVIRGASFTGPGRRAHAVASRASYAGSSRAVRLQAVAIASSGRASGVPQPQGGIAGVLAAGNAVNRAGKSLGCRRRSRSECRILALVSPRSIMRPTTRGEALCTTGRSIGPPTAAAELHVMAYGTELSVWSERAQTLRPQLALWRANQRQCLGQSFRTAVSFGMADLQPLSHALRSVGTLGTGGALRAVLLEGSARSERRCDRLGLRASLARARSPRGQSHNRSVNRTPKSCAFGFPPLRSGAGYVQRCAAGLA